MKEKMKIFAYRLKDWEKELNGDREIKEEGVLKNYSYPGKLTNNKDDGADKTFIAQK